MRFLKILNIQLATKGQCQGENPKSFALMDSNFSMASFPLESQSHGGPAVIPAPGRLWKEDLWVQGQPLLHTQLEPI